MSQQHRYPPNRLLAWERLQRGWSYEEVADRIRAAMLRGGEADTGLSANTVRRWETGERWPEPRYRRYLVEILAKPASSLGLLTPSELRLCPTEDVLAEMGRLVGMVTGDHPQAAGPNRATVLRAMLGVGTLPLLAPLVSLGSAGATAAAEVDPADYEQIVTCQRKLYWTSPPRLLFESAYAHTQLGTDLLRGTRAGQAKSTLAAAVALSGLLAGRLALFDLYRPAVAERCFEVALSATREAGDHELAATVLGHASFVHLFGHRPEAARTLVAAGLQHSWHGVSQVVRSWLHCVASEVETRADAGHAARHHIDLAATALDSRGDAAAPDWLDFYDETRLHSFAGYAALGDGDQAQAAEHLEDALTAVGHGKQRSVILADLAGAHSDDGDRAADYLNQAIDTLDADWYATGLARVQSVRPVLGDSRQGRALDERVAALAAAAVRY